MHTIKLTKIKDEPALLIPNAIAKLYDFEVGQSFNLEIKESKHVDKLVFLTYATVLKSN